jgi:hypothetical protein
MAVVSTDRGEGRGLDTSMVRPELSLPVVWTEDGSTLLPGRLELAGTQLRLAGGSRGAERVLELELRDIIATRLGRTAAERVNGRLTLVLELRAGGSIRVSGFEQPGAMRELADRLHTARG